MRKILLALVATSVIFACKKDDTQETPTPVPDPTPPAQVTVKVRFYYRKGNDTGLTNPPTFILYDATGRKLALTRTRFLASNFRFCNTAGEVVRSLPDAVVLFDSHDATAIKTLGVVDQGSYSSIKLDLGLNEQLNSGSPSTANQPPLNNFDIYENSTSGYHFLHVEGRVDANNDGIISSSEPTFSYKCVTSSLLRLDQIFDSGEINPPQESFAIGVDIAGLFQGIDVMSNLNSVGSGALHVQLMNNLQVAIEEP